MLERFLAKSKILPAKKIQPDDRKVNSILIYVGGDLVGDALMKLPFLRALRNAYPKAHISWCAGKHKSTFAEELAPLVTGMIDVVMEKVGFDKPFKFFYRRPLYAQKFDLVIDTQRGFFSTILVKRIRHKIFVSGTANFFFSDIKPTQPYIRPPLMIHQMLDLLEIASGKAPIPGYELVLPDTEKSLASKILPKGPLYIGLAPGAGDLKKCWPIENFIEVAKNQLKLGRKPVFILGPKELPSLAKLRHAVPDALYPTVDSNKSFKPTVSFSIALGQRLAVAVANDSGAGHILALADIKLISLFGPTSPDKFAPAANKSEIIKAQNYGEAQMKDIPIEAVIEAINALLKN